MEIFVLLLLMLGLIYIQSVVYKKECFKKLKYSCKFSADEVFEDSEIEMIETIKNYKWLPIPWFKSEITTQKWLDFAGSQSVVTANIRYVPSFFTVSGNKKTSRHWKVKCTKRGVFYLKSVVLVATDIWGSNLLSRSVTELPSITVLPKTVDLNRMFINSRYLQGDYSVKNQLIQDPFYVSGVRDYMPSDPMKNIHWNATAKLSRIMIRNLEYTNRQNINIILNMQSREGERDFVIDSDHIENCIRVVATILDITLENNIPVRLCSNTSNNKNNECVETNEDFGHEHVLSLLRILANIKHGSNMAFDEYLFRNYHHFDSTDIVLVTCYLNDEIYRFIEQKKQENTNVKVFLLGLLPESAPSDMDIYYLRQEEQ